MRGKTIPFAISTAFIARGSVSGDKSPDIAWSMPENLVPPYFVRKLKDGSLLLGFKGSRFHSHMFQRGKELIAVVTENAPEGRKRYHESFKVKVVSAQDIFSKAKQKMVAPSDETEAIFFDRTSLFSLVGRLAQRRLPPDILGLLQEIQKASFDWSLAFTFANKLAEWEMREPGVLRRHSLKEARRAFPVNYPCFLLMGNRVVFANLKEDGVMAYPEGLPSDLTRLLGELTRLEHLVDLPIRAGEKDIRMSEEFMNQLVEHYEKAKRDSNLNPG